MLARDIMHRDVVTVTPETSLAAVARLLVKKRFGAVPVTEDGRLVGIVSEADLLHREELGTERRRNRWLDAFASIETLANAYQSAHGQLARDVMARAVVTAGPDTPLAEIVELMERRHIRRVPIVAQGPDGSEQLIGIVTRGDLVRALATLIPGSSAPGGDGRLSDRRIRDMLLAELARQTWTDKGEGSVTVLDGVVHLWGTVTNEAESRALVTAAEAIPGVVAVRDHTFVTCWGADPIRL